MAAISDSPPPSPPPPDLPDGPLKDWVQRVEDYKGATNQTLAEHDEAIHMLTSTASSAETVANETIAEIVLTNKCCIVILKDKSVWKIGKSNANIVKIWKESHKVKVRFDVGSCESRLFAPVLNAIGINTTGNYKIINETTRTECVASLVQDDENGRYKAIRLASIELALV